MNLVRRTGLGLPPMAWWALALSLMGHAAWLVQWHPTAVPAQEAPAARSVKTRLVHAAARMGPLPASIPFVEPTVAPDTAAASPPMTPPASTAVALAPDATTDATPTPSQADDGYLERGALTHAPQALTAVPLDFPVDAPEGQFATELTLYIDETGVVQRARVDGPALPTALERVALQAFLAARFTPGEQHGRPVAARLRIAVEFSSDAPARSTGTTP